MAKVQYKRGLSNGLKKFIFLLCLAAMLFFPCLSITAAPSVAVTAPVFAAEKCIYIIDNEKDKKNQRLTIFDQMQSRSKPLASLLLASNKQENSPAPSIKDAPWYTVGSIGFPSIGLLNHSTKKKPRRPNPYPIPKRVDLAHLWGKGIGYKEGYGKLGLMIGPEYKLGEFLPLLDLRGMVFDDGEFAANVGLVGRFVRQKGCEVIGINLFYDFRQKRWGNFNQFGAGIEVLNKRWEVHANAYFPVGVKWHHKTCVFDDYIGDYKAIRKQYELGCQYAVDADGGYYLVNLHNFQLYGSAGLYFFSQNSCHNESALGVQAILRPQFRDYFALELSVTHDRIYETNYQVNLVFTIPLYDYSSALRAKKGPCGMPTRQIYQPVFRDEIIILNRKSCWKFNWD